MGLSMKDKMFANRDSIKTINTDRLAELDSLRAIEQAKVDSTNQVRISEKFLKTPSRLDDNLLNYVADEDSDAAYIVNDFNGTGQSIDISKIYNALDQINTNNPKHSDLIDEITDTDNWMYTHHTPKEAGKLHKKLIKGFQDTHGSSMQGYSGSDPEKYQDWTAANAFGVGYLDISDNAYYDEYHNEMERQYDALNKEENPWGPNIFKSSYFINEEIISSAIEDRFGTEAWMKADAIAKENAINKQKLEMKRLAENNPDGNRMTSLLKSLEYLENFNNQ